MAQNQGGRPVGSLHVRVLDPLTAYQVKGQPEVRPTAYVADSLLVRGVAELTVSTLEEAAAEAGFDLEWDEQGRTELAMLASAGLAADQQAELESIWVRRVRLVPADAQSAAFKPIDTWRLLQDYRVRVGPASPSHGDVGLDHPAAADPVTAGHPITAGHPMTAGHPITAGHPMTAGHGVGQYSVAGSGGRQPVTWLGAEPTPAYDVATTPRPVVAVLDTGVGAHRWLEDDVVDRDVTVLGLRIGIDPGSALSAVHGVDDPMVGELETDSGHGTFIAGLIRQACPEARILDVPTYGNDGRIAESDLLRSLQLLALRQVLARNGAADLPPVDVVTLSLGYYHEQPHDAAFDSLLQGPLRLLGRYGAAVVVSAGNDATSRPSYPGALAPHDGGSVADDPAVVPLSTVGALNPDGTVAMFSNDGPWVRYLRPGASLVSTFPQTFDASAGPSHQLRTATGEIRSSLDPDDFSSGFGVWSGTSFAAPVLAGELAAALAARYAGGDTALDAPTAVVRMRELLDATATGRRNAGPEGGGE